MILSDKLKLILKTNNDSTGLLIGMIAVLSVVANYRWFDIFDRMKDIRFNEMAKIRYYSNFICCC